VLKTVYRSSCRDKHNCQRCDSNLDPLTPQSDALTTRLLRPDDSYRHVVLKFSREFHCNIGYNESTVRMHNDKMLLPESDSEFGFVSLAAPVTSESPANSSSMKDSLKYLRRSFCRESCRNTSDTVADRLWTKMTTCR